MAGVVLIPGQTMAFPLGDQHQYDEAIRGYLDIKKSYPVQNWDIISTVDELGIINGYGYHTEIWEFVRDLTNPDMKQVKFTTPYVFLFVEKKPIDIANKNSRPLTRADADRPFPVIQSGQLTEFYYGNVDNRRTLEAKAYFWAEDYLRSHSDMTVFLETDNMKIYKIDQHKKDIVLNK